MTLGKLVIVLSKLVTGTPKRMPQRMCLSTRSAPKLIVRTEPPMLATRMPQIYWPTLGSMPKPLPVTNMSPIIHLLLH
jgi:hypothetical protein